jgi:hypothetical protein
MKSGFLNWIMGMMHSKIVKTVKDNLVEAQQEIAKLVKELDDELKSGDPKAFMWDVLSNNQYPLNMTMTQAPKFDHETNLVEFHFDGLFFDSPE